MRSHPLATAALRSCAVLLAAAPLVGAAPAGAAEMGRLSVQSSLGEPLMARIEILGLRPDEAGTVTARLATPGTFARAGIELEAPALGVRFGIETLGSRRYVALWTARPVSKRPLNVIVDMEWTTGRELRAYQLYLEPNGRKLPLELAQADPSLLPEGEQPGSVAPPPSAAPAPRAPATPAVPASVGPRPLPLEVFINGARVGDWVLLDVNGIFHATDDAFQEWRVLRSPDAVGVPYRGQLWYPLSAVPGYEAQFNAANQSLELKFSPSAFATTRLSQPGAEPLDITPPMTSLFANYDLSYTHSRARGAESASDLGALGELGMSGRYGVLTSTFVARNLSEDENLGQ